MSLLHLNVPLAHYSIAQGPNHNVGSFFSTRIPSSVMLLLSQSDKPKRPPLLVFGHIDPLAKWRPAVDDLVKPFATKKGIEHPVQGIVMGPSRGWTYGEDLKRNLCERGIATTFFDAVHEVVVDLRTGSIKKGPFAREKMKFLEPGDREAEAQVLHGIDPDRMCYSPEQAEQAIDIISAVWSKPMSASYLNCIGEPSCYTPLRLLGDFRKPGLLRLYAVFER